MKVTSETSTMNKAPDGYAKAVMASEYIRRMENGRTHAQTGRLLSLVGFAVPLLAIAGVACGMSAKSKTNGEHGGDAIGIGLAAIAVQMTLAVVLCLAR